MRRFLAFLAPYLEGLLGVALVTVLIWLAQGRLSAPNLSVLYVLAVLWIGSRHGRAPALATSLLAFVAYDFFFVPPAGTLAVAGPTELVELAVLLAAALITGQLVTSLERARSRAERAASESLTLYELATAALRQPEVSAALDLACERARRLPGVVAVSVIEVGDGVRPLAGTAPAQDDLRQAAWAFEHRQPIGCSFRGGALTLAVTWPEPAEHLAVLPLTSGALVARFRPPLPDAGDLWLLGALVGLADLLLERRRALVEFERRQVAETSDRLKAAILSSLSHELKSPLASLRVGLTSLRSPRAGLRGEQRELLDDLDRQALRLDRLVGDLLTMSRLEAGSPLELVPRSLPEVLGAVLHRLRPQLGGRGLDVDVPDELPAVLADELQLDRVLTNLLENALDWTPAGGRIEVAAHARPSELEVAVTNDGAAIPPLELDHVFDKFWTRKATGSGLGLAICKRIVEAHGGRVEVRNLRRGPRFSFTLPLAPMEAAVRQ